MPSENIQYLNVFAPPVRGTGDYLTARAANPRTGLISPNVYGESEDESTKPPQSRPETIAASLHTINEQNKLDAALWRVLCPRSMLEVPAQFQEQRVNGLRQLKRPAQQREANQAVPRIAISTVKIASPSGSISV